MRTDNMTFIEALERWYKARQAYEKTRSPGFHYGDWGEGQKLTDALHEAENDLEVVLARFIDVRIP